MKRSTLLKSLLALAAQVAIPAHAATISVTTFADENGAGAGCSLREAVYVANNNVAFGGCPAGNALADDTVVLQAGTYTLTLGEIKITQELKLYGANTFRDEINPLTGRKPDRVRPESIIDAANGSRILSTEGALDAGLELRDLELRNGEVTGNGGAILSWGSVELDNVVVSGSSARGTGLDQGRGGAVYLARTSAGLSMTDSMMVGNTAAVMGGAIAMNHEFNGELALHQVSVNRGVLRGNMASSGAGAIAVSGNTILGLQSSTLSLNTSAAGAGAIDYVLGSAPAAGNVTLRSVTAVENVGGRALRVGGLSTLDVSNSVLAFNPGGNCDFTTQASGTVANTAVQDSVATGCQYPGPTPKITWSDNKEIPAGTALDTELMAYGNAGGLTDGYLPKLTSAHVLNQGQALESCEPADQRGVARNSGTACDAGALERRQLTTVEDEGSNRAKTNRIAYVDILANDAPPEPADPATPVADIWATATVNPTAGAGVSCVWVNDPDDTEAPIQKVLKIDSAGVIGTFTCSYTITIGGVTSSPAAQVEVEIKNSRPIAVADRYVRSVGVTDVSLSLLANDHDANDGAVAQAGLFNTPSPDGNTYLIRITQEPSLGRIEGLSSVDCPVKLVSEPDRKCFAAQGLRYVASNNLSPFTDSFRYVVYDKNKEESAEAVVTITTDAPDPDKKGGSADWMLLGLLAMAGLRRTRRL